MLQQLFNSLTACIAVTSSRHLKTFSLGMGIGKVLAARLAALIPEASLKGMTQSAKALAHATMSSAAAGLKVGSVVQAEAEAGVQRLIDERHLKASLVSAAGYSIGLAVSYFMRHTASTISACSLGSEFLVSAAIDILDPLLQGSGMGSVKESLGGSAGITAVQSGIVAFAVSRMLLLETTNRDQLGILSGLLLLPLTTAEFFANALLAFV